MRAATAAESVTEAIVGLVRSGGFAPGSRLPSERELARQLGVSRPTVRQAIGALVRMGVLETRRGAGTVVAASGQNVFKAPFEMLLLFERPTLEELYEVRELVEVHLAARAAERRTDSDLSAIRDALVAMRATVESPEAQTDPNVAFHEAVARAAHLPVLERFMASLHDSIRAGIEATMPGVRDRTTSYEIHERIYEAIARGSATDARRAMTVHMAMAVEELGRSAPTATSPPGPLP